MLKLSIGKVLFFYSSFHHSRTVGLVSPQNSNSWRPALVVQSALRTAYPLSLITRRSLLITTMITTRSSSSLNLSDERLQQSIALLDSIFSPVDSSNFPLPMSPNEAGACACNVNSIPQRRYLWTDAFAVLSYQTISNVYSDRGEKDKAMLYSDAVEKLIATVHDCLGKPRSNNKEDAMRPCNISPTGYVGLRIGKVHSRIDTDYGMKFDGQYFHYIDKWLFALARTNHVEDGLRIAKSIFPYFFEENYGSGGMRWKLSVNANSPSALPPTYGPNDDTLNALIVYKLLESQRQHHDECIPSLSLQHEIQMLQDSLKNYHPRVTSDALGWGLEAMYDQFVEGHPRTNPLRNFASDALCTSNISLPFRLYGALIGATVSNQHLVSQHELAKVREFCIKYEFQQMKKSKASEGKHREEFAEINRVMLAMALLGSESALCRNQNDPMIRL